MRYLGGPNIRFKNYGLALCAIMILMLLISIGSAADSSPSVKVEGTNIIGTGFSADKTLKLTATYTEKIPVDAKNDKYSKIYKITVSSPKTFTITAKNVDTLKVKVTPIYANIGLLSVTGKADVVDNVATVSYNVPALKYKVKVFGKSDSKSMTLKVQQESTIETDVDGSFSYNIKGIPAGTYNIKIKDGSTKYEYDITIP